MRLRILLPPNLEQASSRDAIPTRVEAELANKQRSTLEKLSDRQLGSLDDASRVVAFSIMQWCGGKLASFLQLDKAQLREIVSALSSQEDFFWANAPSKPIPWEGAELIGVSEHLREGALAKQADEARPSEPAPTDAPPANRAAFDGTPMLVDGSAHFLAIRLPSREHPCYSEIRDLLVGYRFKLEPGNRKWWLRDRHLTLNFLGEHWDDLEARYQAEFTENFTQRLSKVRDASVRTEIIEERNGYRVNLAITAGHASTREINKSLNTGKRYIEAGNTIYLVKSSQTSRLSKVQKVITGDFDAPLLHSGSYKLPYSRALEVEEPLRELNPSFAPPATWKRRSEALGQLQRLAPAPLDRKLDATLRPYQKTGVAWLHHLYTHELGGILADEMGLGKTLQALALVSSLRRSKSTKAPTLIVCPASLVENWRREAERFAPELKVLAHHGGKRIRQAQAAKSCDLIITSYGTLIRDRSLFSEISFDCVIGDEAQHIKNRRTQNAKAITSLQTRGRFLLTGTPIENSIQDLMSLLDFIMPGGWKPIPSGARGEERRWHERRILDQAAPYILRRSKSSVAKELPEKIEQELFIEMTQEQRRIYEGARRTAEAQLEELEKTGASEGALRMKTLTQLLRLRQTCCDPRLLDSKSPSEASAKRNSFIELLEESIDGGHRVLVFSQFVSLLSILREELDSQAIPYCYLDGSTRKRMAEVDRFNSEQSIPVFLISLKAGGTGLNLATADTVVHFDPWWNPAAEAQATDRAHRIGQKRVVTSYKLIVSDSVEEKVLMMQRQKRKLLEEVFEASEAANASISSSELRELIS